MSKYPHTSPVGLKPKTARLTVFAEGWEGSKARALQTSKSEYYAEYVRQTSSPTVVMETRKSGHWVASCLGFVEAGDQKKALGHIILLACKETQRTIFTTSRGIEPHPGSSRPA